MSNVSTWAGQGSWPAEATSVAAARDFVSRHVTRREGAAMAAEVTLVVSELATNAVLHARTRFIVTVCRTRGGDLLTVQDGSPQPPVAARLPVSPMEEHGRGLHVVETCSSEWGLTRETGGGKSVWATFATAAPEAMQA